MSVCTLTKAPISCTGMPMSDLRAVSPAGRQAVNHAAEVAQWAVQLLGWLWLGEQGMRWGWSFASGVSAVALWWAVRIACRGRQRLLQAPPLLMGACGLLTAWGVWLPGFMSGTAHAHSALLVVAVVWGLWCALIEMRSQTSSLGPRALAWHPVVAALLVLAVWHLSAHGLLAPVEQSGVLVACVLVLHAREYCSAWRTVRCKAGMVLRPQLLASSAMGLMMGALWLGDAWCAGLGWTTAQWVWVHLGLMTGLPALVGLGLRALPPGVFVSGHSPYIGLGLMALGALMFVGNTAMHGVLAMLLPSLAWALQVCRYSQTTAVPYRMCALWSPATVRGVSVLLGPGLLMLVGISSASLGPVAMQAALTALGGVAALCLWFSAWHASIARKSWRFVSSP